MSKSDNNAARTSIRNAGYFTSIEPETVQVAVYQQGGTAVVRELRAVELEAGPNQLYLEGMPTQYQPNSLKVLGYDGVGELSLGPISYRAANLDKQRVLLESVGSRVTVKELLSNGRVTNIPGELVAVFGNEVAVRRLDNKRVIIVPTTLLELDEGLPVGLSRTASLMMTPSAKRAGRYDLRLLYQAGGMGWTACYSAFLDEKRGVLTRFECSVALTNQSGTRFNNARVQLVAGANYGVRRGGYAEAMPMALSAAPGGGGRKMRAHDLMAADADVESVGELKMYRLPDAVTIADGETQQVTLFLAKDVPVKQELFLPAGYYYESGGDEAGSKLPVYIRLRLNERKEKLAYALPAGAVNIFQNDSEGQPQMVGETSLSHKAAGEKFKLEFGPSSDVKAQRRLISATDTEEKAPVDPEFPIVPLGAPAAISAAGGPGMPGDRAREIARGAVTAAHAQQDEEPAQFRTEERELTLYNFKDEPVEVLVTEPIPSNTEWLARPEGHEVVEEVAGATTLKVKVDAKSETKVSYSIRYRLN
jgi:hypothetical protein